MIKALNTSVADCKFGLRWLESPYATFSPESCNKTATLRGKTGRLAPNGWDGITSKASKRYKTTPYDWSRHIKMKGQTWRLEE